MKQVLNWKFENSRTRTPKVELNDLLKKEASQEK